MSANLSSFPYFVTLQKDICIYTVFKHVSTYLKHIQILRCTEHKSTSRIVERWVIE